MEMPQKKAGVILLAVAGILVLVLGFWSISYKIKSPFFLKQVDNKLLSNEAVSDLTKDTDGDGLTDWEEANIYHTSAYLEDSDSDGSSDSAEIKGGTDPNCPEGKDCRASQELPAASPALQTPSLGAAAEPTLDLPAVLPADEIRKMLKEAGMSDENLKKLDDKAVLEIYQKAVEEANKGQ